MKTKIFKTSKGDITDYDFEKFIKKSKLKNKDVLVYSRLLDFGRIQNKLAVETILSILKRSIGKKGTLLIPTYTLSTYNSPRIYSERNSKITSGVLGDFSIRDSDFKRTFHPLYSTSVYGKNLEYYLSQDKSTCFGDGSLFDLFSKTKNGIVLMLGLNFNGPTLYHYYDQKYNANGRFIKNFKIKIDTEKSDEFIEVNSFVKNRNFYKNSINCLAMFDALAFKLKYTKTEYLGDGMSHTIFEKDFKKLYKTALEVDQKYFLLAKHKIWKNYYVNNNFKIFYQSISQRKIKQIETKLQKQ